MVTARGALIAGGLLGLAALAIYIAKKGVAGAAAGAVTAAADAAAGAVVGIGQVVGIPATNESECERAKREGRTWDASFACPAGDFLSYTWAGLLGSETNTTAPAPGAPTSTWPGSTATTAEAWIK